SSAIEGGMLFTGSQHQREMNVMALQPRKYDGDFQMYVDPPCEPDLARSDAEIDRYARQVAGLGGVRGVVGPIRAIPKSAQQNCELARRKLPMPVLTIGAASTRGASMEEAGRAFAEDVAGLVAERTGHWIPEERPVWLAERLLSFFGSAR